jgi:DNA-binding protein H-NS
VVKSLSRIQSQIEKLQKEADAIRSAVVARIRKEMAQHGLTAEDLFGEARSTFVGNGRRTRGKAAAKPPKYADGAGNTWGGMGKRPVWIREALEAGRSLEEFLVGAAPKPAQAAKPARKKAAAAKKATPARKPAKKSAPAAAPKKAAKRPARKKASVQAEAASTES